MQGIYLGGYPWQEWGKLTAADLNAAIQIAIQEPHGTIDISQIADGSITNAKLEHNYIIIGVTPIALGQTVPQITGLAAPVNPQDAATKSYVDIAIEGITGDPGAAQDFPNGVSTSAGFTVIDAVNSSQTWRWWAHGGITYLDSNNPDIPNSLPTHTAWSANWTNGDFTVRYNLLVTGAQASQGPITTSNAFYFRDRSNLSTFWGWYADSNLARLWLNGVGDIITVDAGTFQVRAPSALISNAFIGISDAFYPNYSHTWQWWASQGTAYFSTPQPNLRTAIQIDEATAVVTFPAGITSPGGWYWTDQTFGAQQWHLYAYNQVAYWTANNGIDPGYAIAVSYTDNTVFIGNTLQVQGTLSVNQTFVTNATQIRDTVNAGQNWTTVAQGGTWLLRTEDSITQFSVNRTGTVHARGLINTDIGYLFIDAANGPSQQWEIAAQYGNSFLWNNAAGNCIVINYATGLVTFPRGIALNILAWTDTTLTSQGWTLGAHDGFTYLQSSNPDVPNGRATHPVFNANWTNGDFGVGYNLLVQLSATVQGSVTGRQGFYFNDLGNAGITWALYANSGLAYITYNGNPLMSINTNGSEVRFPGQVTSGSVLCFCDPYYGGYARQWKWYANQSTAYLYIQQSNRVAIQVDEASGQVRFPSGAVLGAILFNDAQFPAQQWQWTANARTSYLLANNNWGANNYAIAASWDNGSVYIGNQFFAQLDCVVNGTAQARYGYQFFDQGSSSNWWQLLGTGGTAQLRWNGATTLTIDASGNMTTPGTSTVGGRLTLRDSAYAGGTVYWQWYSNSNRCYWTNNSGTGPILWAMYGQTNVIVPGGVTPVEGVFLVDKLNNDKMFKLSTKDGRMILENNNDDVDEDILTVDWESGAVKINRDLIVQNMNLKEALADLLQRVAQLEARAA